MFVVLMFLVVCPLCRLAKVSCWCQDCDLSFCTDCFNAVHVVQRVSEHNKVNLESKKFEVCVPLTSN